MPPCLLSQCNKKSCEEINRRRGAPVQDQQWLRQTLAWAHIPYVHNRLMVWLAETPHHQKAQLLLRVLEQHSNATTFLVFLFFFLAGLIFSRTPVQLGITLVLGLAMV